MALTTNLSGYYKCEDDAANTTVADAQASADLTASTNTSNMSTAGFIDDGFNLHDGDYYISLTDSDFADNSSISLWVKTPASFEADNQYIVGSSNNPDYRLWVTSAGVLTGKFQGADTETATGSTLSTSTWYHIVVTRDETANTAEVYLDNSSDISFANVDDATPVDMAIGVYQDGQTGNDWAGLIDEVGIWTRALTSSEVTELYNSGSGLQYPFLSDVTVSPSTLTLSTTQQAPSYFIDITAGALGLTSTLISPNVTIPKTIFPSVLPLSVSLLSPSISDVLPNGTISVGSGSIGTTFISNTYPVEEGLIAGTTKQTLNPNL